MHAQGKAAGEAAADVVSDSSKGSGSEGDGDRMDVDGLKAKRRMRTATKGKTRAKMAVLLTPMAALADDEAEDSVRPWPWLTRLSSPFW